MMGGRARVEAGCASRGHELRWATGADGCDWVADAGVVPFAAGVTQQTMQTSRLRVTAGLRQLPPADIPDVVFGEIFGRTSAPAMLRDLLPLVAKWTPDLVVNGAAEFAGPIIAATVGVPSVTRSYGIPLPERRVLAASEQVADLWRSVGLAPRAFGGCYDHLYLDMCPASLLPTPPAHILRRQQIRPVSDDQVAAEPTQSTAEWPSGFPAVYLTVGTVFNDLSLLRTAVDAVASLGVEVLVTVGPRTDPADVGKQPPHVHVERYVPQTTVLSRCRVVVSHAGSGTFFGALSWGLPQLCLPQGADQYLNAAAIAAAGAGLSLHPRAADAQAIAAATSQLLDDPRFRRRAQTIATEISQMPSPDDVLRCSKD